MTTKMESASVCSAIPSSSNTKKRGISRLSFRRLFYTSPLINRPRISSRNKNTSSVDVRAESSSTSTSASDKASLRQEPGLQPISIINDLQSNSISTQFLKTIDAHYLECPLCLTELPIECFPEIATCSHRSCIDCLQQYLKIEITESRVNISCPECTEPLHPTDIRMILNNEILMNKYEDFMLRRVLVSEPDARWCPAPDCSFAVIASGCASCPKLKCERPGCHTYFCYHCKQEWHPNQTCDAARAQRSPNVRSSSVSFSQESAIQRDDIKPCPRCQVLIVKMDDGSCNHMTCAVCGSEFCWLCMKEISDLHYLSPSGCTFWGKKPWSRKKKILWQLGTLVGAPVGIGLVAGIAVPAMIIGIPVWVGRKLHARYEHASKHKRNLAITGGVTASILVSPILAGLAVGIGVPILLAYVYGVVPISLCRSGGCGVTTSASGVRIEFDDETDIAVGTSGHTTDAQSVDTSSHRVANPSIGEVSFGMSASLSMGSGSHLERVGLMRDSDRESASNTAIAGASLTGSVTSSMVGAPAGQRLEVQADVASNKRFSFSSETASATVSLSERSATMSLNDDASTKALAGSILGYRDRDNSSTSCTPVEVHVDASGNAVGYSFINPEESVDQTKGDQASVFLNEDAYTKSSKRLKYRSSAGADKQLNSCAEGESASIWSAEDAVSERVRFDENVSFIDDQPVEEMPFPASETAPSSSQPILQLVNSASWPDNQLLREGTNCDMKHSDWCQAIAEHPETVKEVWTDNCSSVWSALAKQSGSGSRSPTPPSGHMAGTSLTMDLSHQGSSAVPTECKPSRSQLSLPLSTDADCCHGMSWTTHQSLPCILDTEPTLHPVMADLKQI